MRQVGLIFEKGVGKKVDKTVKRTVKPAQATKTAKTDKPADGEKPAQ